MKRLVLALTLLASPVVGLFAWSTEKHPIKLSLVAVIGLLVVVIGLLEVASRVGQQSPERKKLGYLQLTLGADGRVSTSKAVVALWTVVFAAVLVQLSVLVWQGRLTATAAFGGNWNSYLLLLGGPFASAVFAKGIVAARVGSDPDLKTTTTARSATAVVTTTETSAAPSPADAVRNDAGETDLVDTQYVIFSLVAIVYFIGSYALNLSRFVRLNACTVQLTTDCAAGVALPEIPAALLGLTSLAALTYVGQKAVAREGLRVVTLSPTPVAHSGILTITLTNLAATSTVSAISVTFAGEGMTAESRSPVTLSNGTLTVQAPSATGSWLVTIVTPESSTGPIGLTVT